MNYVKKLCESTITLKFNKNSKWNSDIDDKLYDISECEGISINPKDDDTPIAWNAYIDNISGGIITVRGEVSPGGSIPSSSVEIKLPVEEFNHFYDCTLYSRDANNPKLDELCKLGIELIIKR